MHEFLEWHSCFFYLFALLACGFAVAVVWAGNIVYMACCLAASLAAVGGLFFLAGAEFLGAVQLLLYIGGTMVLLVFGVMLTARRTLNSLTVGRRYWVLTLFVCGTLLGMLLMVLPGVAAWEELPTKTSPVGVDKPADLEQLGFALLGVRMDRTGVPEAAQRGDFSGYLLAFELLSLHLVVVLIGAAYLARAKRHVVRAAHQAIAGPF